MIELSVRDRLQVNDKLRPAFHLFNHLNLGKIAINDKLHLLPIKVNVVWRECSFSFGCIVYKTAEILIMVRVVTSGDNGEYINVFIYFK